MTNLKVSIVFDGTEGDKSIHTLIAKLVWYIDNAPFQRTLERLHSNRLAFLIVSEGQINYQMLVQAKLEIENYIIHCTANRKNPVTWKENSYLWAKHEACVDILKEGVRLATDVRDILDNMCKQITIRSKNC